METILLKSSLFQYIIQYHTKVLVKHLTEVKTFVKVKLGSTLERTAARLKMTAAQNGAQL